MFSVNTVEEAVGAGIRTLERPPQREKAKKLVRMFLLENSRF